MRKWLIVLSLLGMSTAMPAAAQLLSERVDGRQRLCIYPPEAGNYFNGDRGQRVHRTGLGENCPATYPSASSDLPVPPTARLLPRVTRDCLYEQGASEWVLPLPPSGICPPYAGMAQARRSPGR